MDITTRMTLMIASKLITVLVLALSPLGSTWAADLNESPEEIVVTGRYPGPPLWKVSNGQHVLWIFPYLDWVQRDMIWDSERVARVIAESQQFLDGPHLSSGWPKVILLNPISIARATRHREKTIRNPDGGTLEENLPPALYARFTALQTRYFPGNNVPLEMRPLYAGAELMNAIREREGLVAGDDVLKQIQRLVRRSRDIRHTEIAGRANFGDSYSEFVKRSDALYATLTPEREQQCFEQQVRHVEEDLDEIKSLANSWAQGDIDGFRNLQRYNVPLTAAELSAFAGLDACIGFWTGELSPERENIMNMMMRLRQEWLDAADNALARNASTFAILPITELVAEGGLLSELKAKGYEVTEP
jgi:hypothetical protein